MSTCYDNAPLSNGEDYGRRIYKYFSPYYKVETYHFVYMEKIEFMPSEESWKIPMKILEKKIPPPFVEPRQSGRKAKKRGQISENHFQVKRTNIPYAKKLAQKNYMLRAKCSIRTLIFTCCLWTCFIFYFNLIVVIVVWVVFYWML